MDWVFVSTPNSHIEILISSVTIFGPGAFKKVIKVKHGHKSGALIQQDWCSYKKR